MDAHSTHDPAKAETRCLGLAFGLGVPNVGSRVVVAGAQLVGDASNVTGKRDRIRVSGDNLPPKLVPLEACAVAHHEAVDAIVVLQRDQAGERSARKRKVGRTRNLHHRPVGVVEWRDRGGARARDDVHATALLVCWRGRRKRELRTGCPEIGLLRRRVGDGKIHLSLERRGSFRATGRRLPIGRFARLGIPYLGDGGRCRGRHVGRRMRRLGLVAVLEQVAKGLGLVCNLGALRVVLVLLILVRAHWGTRRWRSGRGRWRRDVASATRQLLLCFLDHFLKRHLGERAAVLTVCTHVIAPATIMSSATVPLVFVPAAAAAIIATEAGA